MTTQGVTSSGQQSMVQFTNAPKGTAKYANKVQGFAYGGAAFLVVIIGLRSIYGRNIPTWVVVTALGLEAFLLVLIATVYYFTPEDKGGAAASTDSQILSGEKEILQLLKKDVITGENEMIRILKTDLVGGQKELVSVVRNELLASQREIADALKAELTSGNSESLRLLQRLESLISKIAENEPERISQANTIASGQRELVNVMRNEVLVHDREIFGSIRNEIANSGAQSLHMLQRIEAHIGKVIENEIERVVQAKVQEVFTAMVRQEVNKSLEANRNAKA